MQQTGSVVLLNKKYIYCYLKCIVYDKLLKHRQSLRITLYIVQVYTDSFKFQTTRFYTIFIVLSVYVAFSKLTKATLDARIHQRKRQQTLSINPRQRIFKVKGRPRLGCTKAICLATRHQLLSEMHLLLLQSQCSSHVLPPQHRISLINWQAVLSPFVYFI